MGLKSGSRDSGLDEDEQENGSVENRDDGDAGGLPEGVNETAEQAVDAATSVADEVSDVFGGDTTCEDGEESESPDHPSVDSIPYKLRRQNVNDGREQVPYFLRPEITAGEEELKQTLESDLGETVYKSDYREAAMVVAQRNPDLIAEVLREWGYDLSDR